MNKTKTYYQPIAYYDDGTNIEWGDIPNELASFEAFASREDCEEWLENNGYNSKAWCIKEYHDEDIEGVTILDEDGDIIETNEEDKFEDIPYTTSELEEKVFYTSVPYNDSTAFQSALQFVKEHDAKRYKELLYKEFIDYGGV